MACYCPRVCVSCLDVTSTSFPLSTSTMCVLVFMISLYLRAAAAVIDAGYIGHTELSRLVREEPQEAIIRNSSLTASIDTRV